MAKKQIIQIVGNPMYARRPPKGQSINNPATGLPSFGTFPAIALPERPFDGGQIYLRYGEHRGPNRGWGLEHIWKARFPKELTSADAEPLVTDMLTKILAAGAEIHYAFELGNAGNRVAVIKRPHGTVIVEERHDGRGVAFYSIVTAIESTKTNGSKIGAI